SGDLDKRSGGLSTGSATREIANESDADIVVALDVLDEYPGKIAERRSRIRLLIAIRLRVVVIRTNIDWIEQPDDYHPWALRPVVEGRSDHLLRLGIPLSVLVQASEVLNTLPRLARCTALIQRRHFPDRRRNAARLDLVPQVRIRIAVERKIPVALALLVAGLGLQQDFQAPIAFDTRGARAEAGRIRILGI